MVCNTSPSRSSIGTTSSDSSPSSSPSKKCPKCFGDHFLSNCSQFLDLSVEQRLELLPNYKICYNCLQPNHFSNRCKKSGCRICKRKHSFLIHRSESSRDKQAPVSTSTANSTTPALPTSASSNGESGTGTSVALSTCISTRNQDVLLSTALIKVYDAQNCAHTARAVLDSGSTSCLMTKKLSSKLNLPRTQVNRSVHGINNAASRVHECCRVPVESFKDNFKTKINCFVMQSLTDYVPSSHVNISELNIPSDIQLADPAFHTPSEVDMIIGADLFWDILGSQKIILGRGKPILWETRFGWVVAGPVSYVSKCLLSPSIQCNFSAINGSTRVNDDIETNLMRFWQLEEVGLKSSYSEEEQACEDHFVKNTTRLPDGRFCVRLPLKQSANVLGDSLPRAKHCLLSLEKRLKRDTLFCERYRDFMSEYLKLGHMSECDNHLRNLGYFIPHHGVVRESSLTTKLRVVYNASSPTTSNIALNNILMVGPTIQDDLLSILLRFRCHKIILAGDVEKMYRNVVVHPDDRHLQQIIWRDNPSETIKCFQLNTVTYGTASAPFLATRCLKQIGLDCENKQISEIIIHDFYVDDLLTGAQTLQEALDIKNKVTSELASAGMPLRKWKSNNSLLMTDESKQSSVDLNIGALECSKTLGLYWNNLLDQFYFQINCNIPTEATKRSILSVISQIFDPMGLLTPCTVTMKIMLQKLWLHKLSWDEKLPLDLYKHWVETAKRLPILNDLRINRRVVIDDHEFIDLHIFSDASQLAYGSCVYVRSINDRGEVLVSLLLAKSRVSPLKPTTIPRLELCGALASVRLYEKVTKSLRVKVRKTFVWTDSMIVLGWLKMLPIKLQPFVRNRVAEILEVSGKAAWRHVPTDLNPADLISRGLDPALMQACSLWWSGPEFLKQDENQWPSNPEYNNSKSLPETKEVTLHTNVEPTQSLIDFSRFSNFSRLNRAIAYALKFINKCKKQTCDEFLTSSDLQNALNLIIKISQMESFSEYQLLKNDKKLPKNSTLNKFNVFLDENQLMRVGGRLDNSDFSYDKKHPIILQSSHLVTRLLFKHEHKRLMHAGPQLLLASIRETYWPIGGRNLAKLCYRNCVRCNRMRGKVVPPLMGNLPSKRVQAGGYPFENVGIDYAGPILSASRQGRGCRLVKVYIVIFVCFATKAMHIELVGDLTSNNFLSAARRFMSRRGKSKNWYTDNGSSFIGAFNEISKFLKSNCSSLSEDIANEGVNFHFLAPYAAHQGGLWEAGVKSVKFHLQRVLGNCHLTYEELNTVLVQIEAILNSRPLTPLSTEPDDLMPLTPGHFIIGRPLTSLPAPNYVNSATSQLTRYQRLEQLRQHFWARWSKEYIAELQKRGKWRTGQGALKVNGLVLLKDDQLPPLKWKLGRIVTLYPGADGISRVADIRTSTGIVRRAFSKICPLPDDEISC
ncbi:uncharacterized protein LOC123875556 isoform X2 [Maniola jurtina]|nr:uncharacterized protein LOC123875556 isoform X2 [Maniola jurtina]XP_045777395.1 uncharacterized protein LOC123875556 isoform X2 [Maniola jurtina]